MVNPTFCKTEVGFPAIDDMVNLRKNYYDEIEAIAEVLEFRRK